MPEEERPKLEIISGGANLNVPPKPDEIEISIFGPGYGECITVHLGCDHWFIVDSCIDVHTREPAALAYFKTLNVDPAVSVKQVVATHWHDDHIRGFAELFEACKSAQLVLSDALKVDEFFQLVMSGSETMISSSGTDELHRVMEILRARKDSKVLMLHSRKENRIRNHVPFFAIQGRPIWKGGIDNGQRGSVRCEIVSLSPSDSAVLASRIEFARLLPDAGETKGWVPPITPNHASVVIRLKVGNFSILLGADLEERGEPETGWSAIINAHSPEDGKSSAFKIPHHGSKTGHHDKVWQDMLTGQPVAILTPFHRGNVSLPTDNDVRRLISYTPNVFMTCRVEKKSVKRDRTVEKAIKEAVRSIRVLDGSFGHVRIRFKSPDLATVELFGDARRLELPPEPSRVASKKGKAKA
jgi:hypothetical protein